jgi:hypothetical protein
MKKFIYIFFAGTTFLSSCGGGSENKQEELAKLKTQQKEKKKTKLNLPLYRPRKYQQSHLFIILRFREE